MRIPREVLIAVRCCRDLTAEYRIEIGPDVAGIHRRRQLDRGDGARSRAGTGCGGAFTEQVRTQPGVGRILGEMR